MGKVNLFTSQCLVMQFAMNLFVPAAVLIINSVIVSILTGCFLHEYDHCYLCLSQINCAVSVGFVNSMQFRIKNMPSRHLGQCCGMYSKSIHVINEANSAVNLHVLPEDTLQTVKKQHRIGFFS